tara:strand:- start:581 stop:859 length:279 start_codon:yes stop_codon:yes gene_type:complete
MSTTSLTTSERSRLASKTYYLNNTEKIKNFYKIYYAKNSDEIKRKIIEKRALLTPEERSLKRQGEYTKNKEKRALAKQAKKLALLQQMIPIE